MTLANSATVTQSFSPSPTVTETVIVLFHFSIIIYNGAGEQVKTLTDNTPALFNPAADFAIDQNTFAPKNGQQLLVTAGGKGLVWSGDNDSGQVINNGVYYMKMQYTDPFGHVESMTKEISVLSSAQVYSVSIFNSAGEEVKTLAVASYGLNAPSHMDPDKPSIASGQGSGAAGTVTFDLGNGTSVSWDGSNSQGQKVGSGSYLAQLIETHAGAPKNVVSASVTVLSLNEGMLASAILAPNPLNMTGAGDAAAGFFILKLTVLPGTEVVGRLYNMAGELVITTTNDMQSGDLRFDMGGKGASSGTYILSVTAKAPWGTVERRNIKMVLIR